MWHDQDVAGRDAIWSAALGRRAVGGDRARHADPADRELLSSRKPRTARQRHPVSLHDRPMHPGTGNVTTQPALGHGDDRAAARPAMSIASNFYGLATRDFRDATTDQATIRVEHDFGGVTLRNTARYTHNDQSYIFTLPDDSQGNVYGTTATNSGASADQRRLCLAARGNTRYGYSESIDRPDRPVRQIQDRRHRAQLLARHRICVGKDAARHASCRRADRRSRPRCNTATIARSYCTSLFDAESRCDLGSITRATRRRSQTPIVRGPRYRPRRRTTPNTNAVYAFDSITLMPRLILNLGARYDRFTSIAQPGLADAATPRTRIDAHRQSVQLAGGLVFKPTARDQPLCQLCDRRDAAQQPAGRGPRGQCAADHDRRHADGSTAEAAEDQVVRGRREGEPVRRPAAARRWRCSRPRSATRA